jgi:lipopolysaccharide export system protein LptA
MDYVRKILICLSVTLLLTQISYPSEQQSQSAERRSVQKKCEKTELAACETMVESDEARYNGELITLSGHVVVENTMGRITADLAILKKDPEKRTKIDFPWIELKHHVLLTLADGGILNCATLFLDYTTMSAWIGGDPQVIYSDALGRQVFADRAHIDYQEVNGTLEATRVTLYDNVRLVNLGSVEKPTSQYALADEVTYFPPEQRMVLEGRQNRVLFYDTLRDVQLSARSVCAQKDRVTQKESVQGIGDVRFVFGPDELEKIKTRFK